MQKIRVIFDTNIFWSNSEDKIQALNPLSEDSYNFIKENNLSDQVDLLVPEILVQERIEQTFKSVKNVLLKIRNGNLYLKDFGIDYDEKKYEKDYPSLISERIYRTLSDLNFKILKTPSLEPNNLIERCLKKLSPFASGPGDNGFKDTVIWLTLLNDVEKNQNCDYVLCTNDKKAFVLENLIQEFKSVTNRKFNVINDLSQLKEYLDSEMNLDLKLKETHKGIINNIKENLGELIVQFNKHKSSLEDGLGFTAKLAPSYEIYSATTAYTDPSEIIGYDFKGFKVKDINEISTGEYIVSATLDVKPRRKEKKTNPFMVETSFHDYRTAAITLDETYSIKIYYNTDTNNFILTSVERDIYAYI